MSEPLYLLSTIVGGSSIAPEKEANQEPLGSARTNYQGLSPLELEKGIFSINNAFSAAIGTSFLSVRLAEFYFRMGRSFLSF